METYRNNLRHVARPSSPSERDTATSYTIPDHAALAFADALREYATYVTDKTVRSEVAMAYAEYINEQVRDKKRGWITLYAHTDVALSALWAAAQVFSDMGVSSTESVEEAAEWAHSELREE